MHQLISPKKLQGNVFSLFDDQWALVTAGTAEHCNTMTVSWGGLGVLWNKPVATIYIRPQRYTFPFLEENPEFTLSFFGEQWREQLAYCGSVSGRETDKIKDCGLTLQMDGITAPYFQEAELVLVCRKLYWNDLKKETMQPELLDFYEEDFHRMYVGEITKVYQKI